MCKRKPWRSRFQAAFWTPRRERAFSRPKDYADLYHGVAPIAGFLNQRLAYVLERLASIGGGRLLDAGCGPGILLNRLAGGPFELFGIDLSPEMIQEVQTTGPGKMMNLAVARLEQVPYPDDFFDIILALGILEYVDIEAALKELARIAKPNALILVSMLNRKSLYWFWHMHIYRAWIVCKSLLGKRQSEPFPTLYKESVLEGMMKKCMIEPLAVTYYNVNICVEPFGTRYSTLASRLNHAVEHRAGKMLSHLVHTGLIIEAVKRRSIEAAT